MEGSSAIAPPDEEIDKEGGSIFELMPGIQGKNESVLWDLEAPVVGNMFDRYTEVYTNGDRPILVDGFEALMESMIANCEPRDTVLDSLRFWIRLFQLRKNEHEQFIEDMEGAASYFKYWMLYLNFEMASKRLDRALVSYMLKMLYVNTARKFAAARKIQGFYQFEPFDEAVMIITALRNKDLGPAITWCSTNGRRMKYLAFRILCQKFIEFVRADDKMKAISFARKFNQTYWEYENEILRVVATALFGRNTQLYRYKKLFDEECWDSLVILFERHFIWRHRFPPNTSSLSILLESGITALKVPFCYDHGDCKMDDPLQHEYFRTFATSLPFAKSKPSSTLRCHVTKKRLTKENPSIHASEWLCI